MHSIDFVSELIVVGSASPPPIVKVTPIKDLMVHPNAVTTDTLGIKVSCKLTMAKRSTV